jgi:hypothetical protein
MIVPVIIDTNALTDQFDITPQQIDNLCDNIAKTLAARYANQLEQEANNALHQTRNIYIQNIHVADTGKLEGTVILDYSKNPLVKMIEEGASPFDMKSSMLNSPKAKMGKNGKYITIPFRVGTPDAIADSDVFSGKMPQEIYDIVRVQPTNIPVNGGTRSQGLTFNQLPTKYQGKNTRPAITDSAGKVLFKAYEHKNPINQGVFKKTDGVTGQNTYHNMRRISENSDPDSWIHKGIEQYNLVSKAMNNFNQETEVQVSLNNELKRLGFL